MRLYLDPLSKDVVEVALKYTDGAFVLPHKWSEAWYREYVFSTRGEPIIDNGAYEWGEAVRMNEFASLVEEIAEHFETVIVVLPDKLANPGKTRELTSVFLKYYAPKLLRSHDVAFLYVLHSLDTSELTYVTENELIDLVGIPIWMFRKTHRPRDVKYVVNYTHKPVHLLGLDCPAELLEVFEAASIDTSLPFTLAYHKVTLNPNATYHLPRPENEPYDDTQRQLANLNCRILRKYVVLGLRHYRHYSEVVV